MPEPALAGGDTLVFLDPTLLVDETFLSELVWDMRRRDWR